jgi:RimJ/RimL family protein N-acetyltransferase
MLHTNRLVLRQWTDNDLASFAQLNADPQVMEYFPATLSRAESDDFANTIRSLIEARGWGLWAVEAPGQAAFIGFVGLHRPADDLPCSPCVEIGWRLLKAYWGKGYASEAASAALGYAFEQIGLDEVVSFTAVINKRSQAVMQKIGMSNTGQNFRHPRVDPVSPLCEHVLYKIFSQDWKQLGNRLA